MSRALTLRYLLAAIAIVGACASGVLGVASFLFHRGDPYSVKLACRLVPFNSEYLARLSSYYPDRRTELLRKAASFNPYSEQVWLQLGLDAEFHHHDFSAAEHYYLRAAQVSHLFLPRWTLTNFYFRHQEKPEFLKWARASLEITPYPADPIFTEMWLVDPGHAGVAADLPNSPAILEQYLSFLMTARQYAFVPPIVKRLVAAVPRSQANAYGLDNAIGPALDSLLGSGYLPEAIQIWNDLSVARWISFATPTPNQPLTNGHLGPLFGHGFDWYFLNSPGTTVSHQNGEIAVDLSSNQPETCELLQQWIPLAASRSYRLQWKATAAGLREPCGLSWLVRSSNLYLRSTDLLADDKRSWNFQTSSTTHLALLTLEYKRPLGETKALGTLRLREVSLQPQ